MVFCGALLCFDITGHFNLCSLFLLYGHWIFYQTWKDFPHTESIKCLAKFSLVLLYVQFYV